MRRFLDLEQPLDVSDISRASDLDEEPSPVVQLWSTVDGFLHILTELQSQGLFGLSTSEDDLGHEVAVLGIEGHEGLATVAIPEIPPVILATVAQVRGDLVGGGDKPQEPIPKGSLDAESMVDLPRGGFPFFVGEDADRHRCLRWPVLKRAEATTPNGLEMSRLASASIVSRIRFAAAGGVGSGELLGSHRWIGDAGGLHSPTKVPPGLLMKSLVSGVNDVVKPPSSIEAITRKSPCLERGLSHMTSISS